MGLINNRVVKHRVLYPQNDTINMLTLLGKLKIYSAWKVMLLSKVITVKATKV